MKEVFLAEFRQLPQRLGGLRGAMILAGMIVLGTLPVYRFGAFFADPLVMAAYAWFALLFASAFVVRAFMEAPPADPELDSGWVFGKVLAAAVYGLLIFALILGAAILVLGRPPRAGLVLPTTLLAAGLAWAISGIGAVTSLSVFSAASARQLLRLGFFFVVLLLVAGSRFAPPAWRAAAAGLLAPSRFAQTCLIAAAVCVAAGWFFARRAIRILQDRRSNLSILQ